MSSGMLARLQWGGGEFLKQIQSDGGAFVVRRKVDGALRVCKLPLDTDKDSVQEFSTEQSALMHLRHHRWASDGRAKYVVRLLETEYVRVNPPPTERSHSSSVSSVRRLAGGKRVGGRRQRPHTRALAAADSKPRSVRALMIEYAPGGDLFHSVIKPSYRLTKKQLRTLLRQILRGISLLHDAGVIHMDLKPENICTGERWKPRETRGAPCGGVPCVKIIDFGLSEMTSAPTRDTVGTDAFMAPEVFRGSPHTTACDIWSFGRMVYEFGMSGKPERTSSDSDDDDYGADYYDSDMGSDSDDDNMPVDDYHDLDYLNPFLFMQLGEQGVNVIRACMQAKANRRPSAAALLENFPYFATHTYDTDSDAETVIEIDTESEDDAVGSPAGIVA